MSRFIFLSYLDTKTMIKQVFFILSIISENSKKLLITIPNNWACKYGYTPKIIIRYISRYNWKYRSGLIPELTISYNLDYDFTAEYSYSSVYECFGYYMQKLLDWRRG